MYQVTREEDVNVFDGDTYLPQENFPPTTPAAANDPAGHRRRPADPADAAAVAGRPASSRPAPGRCTRCTSRTRPSSPAAAARSRASDRPLCDDKLVTVRAGQAVAPELQPVHRRAAPHALLGPDAQRPRPDPRQAQRQLRRGAGPARTCPSASTTGPAGSSTRRTPTSTASTRRSSRRRAPTTARCRPDRARTCTASWATTPDSRVHLNPDYNPRFRTIATNFQAWPGLYTVTDRRRPRSPRPRSRPDTTVATRRSATSARAPAAARRGPAVRPQVLRRQTRERSPSRASASGRPGHRRVADRQRARRRDDRRAGPTRRSSSRCPTTHGDRPGALAVTASNGLRRRVNGSRSRCLDTLSLGDPRRDASRPTRLIARGRPGQARTRRSRPRSRRPRPTIGARQRTGSSSSGRTRRRARNPHG